MAEIQCTAYCPGGRLDLDDFRDFRGGVSLFRRLEGCRSTATRGTAAFRRRRPSDVHDVHLDPQVFREKVGWVRTVGDDAAYSGCSEHHDIRLDVDHKIEGVRPVAEIYLGRRGLAEVLDTARAKRTPYCRTRQTSMARDVNLGGLGESNSLAPLHL